MSSNMTQAFDHTSGECFEVGTVVGDKYQLLRKAGEGAMGSVWVATNTALEANVAIKVLRPEMRSPAIAERLLREARAAAKLSHPGIVRVFDLGKTAGGTPYIVMELLEGEALRDVLCREHRLAPEVAVSILLPVASAMHAAHERGVVHRDLKPDNVMLANQGDGRIRPKVVDFGIAKVTWTEPESGSTGAAVIGTPQYMPPEQALGQGHIDHRADVWALCTMLYEVIAGETPYAGEHGFGTLRAIIQDPVRSLVERCGSDPALWSIIERGLRKDPAERWGSMRELGGALAAWLVARGVSEDVSGASLRAQWLEERASQIPSPSPRQVAVSSAPTLHSRRADDSLELQLPLTAPQRAPGAAERKGIEESGERAWSEATAMVNLPGAASPSPRSSWRERFPLRAVAAAGLVALAGAGVWSVALGTTGSAVESTLAPPVEPAAMIAAAPSPAQPALEAISRPAGVAPGSVAPPAGPTVPRPARALKATVPAPATPAAAARTATAAPAASAPAATGKPPAPAASAPPGSSGTTTGAEAPAPPAQPVSAGSAPVPGSACSAGGGREGGEAACPPAAEASASAAEVYDDAGTAEKEPAVHRAAPTEEAPPSADAGAAEGSSSAPAAP